MWWAAGCLQLFIFWSTEASLWVTNTWATPSHVFLWQIKKYDLCETFGLSYRRWWWWGCVCPNREPWRIFESSPASKHKMQTAKTAEKQKYNKSYKQYKIPKIQKPSPSNCRESWKIKIQKNTRTHRKIQKYNKNDSVAHILKFTF